MEKTENWFYEDLPQTESTNDAVLDLLKKVHKPCIVSAVSQTKGRGRLKRSWQEGQGNLFVSFAYSADIKKIGHYVILSGLAVLETIKTFAPEIKVQVKWPNDVLAEGKKISGILFEKGPEDYWVMGIGINVACTPNVENPIYQITSLKDFGISADRKDVLIVLIKHFDFLKKQYEKHGFESLKSLWLDNAYHRGKKVLIKQNGKEFEGVLTNLSDDGSLMLDTKNGVIKILAGDVF